MPFVGCAGTHRPLTWPLGRPKAPPRHAVALLNPPPLFTQSPRLTIISFYTCLLLALPCLKERYKNNKSTKETTPLTLSLSRALGRRWVLTSLSRPALVSTSALALTQTETRRRTGRSKVLAGPNDPKLHSQPPRLRQHVHLPPSLLLRTASCTRCSRPTIYRNSPVHPRNPEP